MILDNLKVIRKKLEFRNHFFHQGYKSHHGKLNSRNIVDLGNTELGELSFEVIQLLGQLLLLLVTQLGALDLPHFHV